MDVVKALGILNFNDIQSVDRETLKKSYRSLIRKNHPDLCQGDKKEKDKAEEITKQLNKAYELLSNLLDEIDELNRWENITKKVIIRTILPFQTLEDLYDNKPITLRSSNGESIQLNKGGLKAHNIMFLLECDIVNQCDGVVKHFSTIKPYNLSDEYLIDTQLQFTDDCYNSPSVTIKAYNKELNITLKNEVTKVKLAYKHRVFLIIQIEKKRIKEENK